MQDISVKCAIIKEDKASLPNKSTSLKLEEANGYQALQMNGLEGISSKRVFHQMQDLNLRPSDRKICIQLIHHGHS
ncbi:hypothetical protein PoB_004418900 [Plakobranchus ocellatus]|uniref:Uncharacterized protein n=1 Tax=Plakobranchus ocellatus TaxID=259542 RepID=A0AAV4BH66_9GAST|nr:hypothetical protein PoB_004418900 [Plakobranchus ocellatus]